MEKAHASDVYILPLTMCGYYGGYVLLDIATCWALGLSITWSAKAQKCGLGGWSTAMWKYFFGLLGQCFEHISKKKNTLCFHFFFWQGGNMCNPYI